jgi:two-component system sensor histidine kinase VicK
MQGRALLSMRWWLALAFAAVAALTAVAVAQVFSSASESAIRERAAELAAGTAVAGATRITGQETPASVSRAASEFAALRNTAVFVFDERGALLTPARSSGVDLSDVEGLDAIVDTALSGRRFVEADDDGRSVIVALPLGGDPARALLTVSSRPDLEDALGIVRREILPATLWAVFIGAIAGLVIAVLITRRLRRIARAAAEIERGRFDQPLEPRFPDELGELASTVDRMRSRLSASFAHLESERERLRRLLEQLQEGVVAVGPDLRVEFTNSRARLLIGTSLRSGQPLPDPWPWISLTDTARSLFAPGAQVTSLRVEPSPSHTYLLAGLPPSPGTSTAVLVVTDITERERRERAEREFVTNAAHELRTPLTAMASAVEVLQAGAKDDPAQRDRFLALVERQTGRLTALVHALLTLARAQTQAEPVRLEDVVLRPLLLDIAEHAKLRDADVDVVCAPGLTARTHPELLRQAVENLVANALTHGGGADVQLRALETPAGTVRLEVVDHGPGMSDDQAARALDRFYRAADRPAEGFGLGLAIVREVADAIDGSLSVESAPGVGATVAIELPATEAERTRA